MKGLHDRITLTRISWNAQEPVPGDALVTRTGRKYLIMDVNAKKLSCMVVSKDEQIYGTTFEWHWAPRSKVRRTTLSQLQENRDKIMMDSKIT